MNTENSFIGDLKRQYKHGGIAIRLIFLNVLIFIGISVVNVFAGLSSTGTDLGPSIVDYYISNIFGLQSDPSQFIRHPWGLFTYMFAHYDLIHLFMNMLFLYFAGRIFVQLFGEKRLLYTYILGGVFGGILEVVAHGLFPKLEIIDSVVFGASGSIMAIFIAIAFYRPQMKVSFFKLFELRIIFLAVVFILLDFLSLGKNDGTAHFAHLGGAVLGVLSIQSLNSPGNIINRIQQVMNWFKRLFSFSRKSNLKVKKGGQNTRVKTDEAYNIEKKNKQDITNKILDKISKSGYDSLTKKEKDFLFNQSKK